MPPTRYADVLGQDAAVDAVRDLIELPIKHGELFRHLGATPRGQGIILAGPPGTGKTPARRDDSAEHHVSIVASFWCCSTASRSAARFSCWPPPTVPTTLTLPFAAPAASTRWCGWTCPTSARAALFEYYLGKLKLAAGLAPERLAAELAAGAWSCPGSVDAISVGDRGQCSSPAA